MVHPARMPTLDTRHSMLSVRMLNAQCLILDTRCSTFICNLYILYILQSMVIVAPFHIYETNLLPRIKRPFRRLQLPLNRIPNIPGGSVNATRFLRFAFRRIAGSLKICIICKLRVRAQ